MNILKLFFAVGIAMSSSAQAHDDVTVLQAWMGSDNLTANQAMMGHGGNGNVLIDATLCKNGDCSTAVEKAEGEPLANTYPMNIQGTSYCQTIQIRTVTPIDVANSPIFSGIGFSYNHTNCEDSWNPQQSGVFVPKEKLKQVGTTVILKDGTPAIVYAFAAQGICYIEGDDGYQFMVGMEQFKPYAKYALGNPDVRWDSASDYKMECVPVGSSQGYSPNHTQVSSFDRQSDLLKQ